VGGQAKQEEQNMKNFDINHMAGLKIKSIEGLEQYSEAVKINTECGKTIVFYHYHECCESVLLEDFECDAEALAGANILLAEEVTKEATEDEIFDESGTWTFYKIETDKGELWMRWLGQSNGFYSEAVKVGCIEDN
jgi:hypothetical protein